MAALLVPALFVLVGLFSGIAGLRADGPLDLFGMEMNPRFAIAFGAIGIFGGIAIAVEMVTRKKREAAGAPRRDAA